MGEEISDERFEEFLLQGLTDDYEFVKMMSFHSPNLGIDERNLYIDQLSRPGHANKLAGRGAAMTTSEGSRKIRCCNRQYFGYIKRDCTPSKKERRASPERCSLRHSTTYSDAERNAKKRQPNTENPPQGEVPSAHTATESIAIK